LEAEDPLSLRFQPSRLHVCRCPAICFAPTKRACLALEWAMPDFRSNCSIRFRSTRIFVFPVCVRVLERSLLVCIAVHVCVVCEMCTHHCKTAHKCATLVRTHTHVYGQYIYPCLLNKYICTRSNTLQHPGSCICLHTPRPHLYKEPEML